MPHYRRPQKEVDAKIAELEKRFWVVSHNSCLLIKAQLSVLRGEANADSFDDEDLGLAAQIADNWMAGVPGEWDNEDKNLN